MFSQTTVESTESVSMPPGRCQCFRLLKYVKSNDGLGTRALLRIAIQACKLLRGRSCSHFPSLTPTDPIPQNHP